MDSGLYLFPPRKPQYPLLIYLIVIDKDIGFFPPFLVFCTVNILLVIPTAILVAYVEVS